MSDDDRFLALLLDAPMQSWGFGSQFERRTTGLMPSKSGIAGLLCAALGCAKGSELESCALSVLRNCEMRAISMPRSRKMRRIEDFHTVLNTRRASNKPNQDPVVTRREYLVDARFGIVLKLPSEWAQKFASALENPVWGMWFGRKCCLPAEPVCRGVFETGDDAEHRLLNGHSIASHTRARDSNGFESDNDRVRDQPISFGSPESSGSHLREYGVRRIVLKVAESEAHYERPSPTPKDSR